jgi:hypothetical protein
MPRNVNHSSLDASGQLQGRKAKDNGDSPLLLLRKSIRIHARQSAHEGRLAVVDMTRRTDDD